MFETSLLAFLGWPEIILILLVLLLMFGAKKLPELARGLGKGINEFKKASREVQDELQRAVEEEPKTSPPQSAQAGSTPSTPAAKS